ncbi:MAG TPA: YhcH/YjgK/YiaL family protein [Mucilaginibacter sp.]
MIRSIKLLGALLFIFFTVSALAQQQTDPAKWSDKQVARWFAKGNWYKQTRLKPDISIDKREFAVRYYKNKALWDKAFAFLRDSDLTALKPGVHELQGKDLFVKITDYLTKDAETIPFESHTKYSDIHTVVSGKEYIGESAPAVAAIKTPYNDEKDIAFYTVTKSHNLLGVPGKFFLLFPDNLHRQGVQVNKSELVRKIVIKVKN